MANKRAKARQSKQRASAPKAARPQGPSAGHPFFCFKYTDIVTTNGYAFTPSEQEARKLLRFIREMAQLSWAEIEQQRTGGKKRHRKHHDQAIESVQKCARNDLLNRGLDTVFGDRNLFRFRIAGEQRLWGFRIDRTFHAVWWDPEHLVYPTEPRRT